jgi:hypothetical protein
LEDLTHILDDDWRDVLPHRIASREYTYEDEFYAENIESCLERVARHLDDPAWRCRSLLVRFPIFNGDFYITRLYLSEKKYYTLRDILRLVRDFYYRFPTQQEVDHLFSQVTGLVRAQRVQINLPEPTESDIEIILHYMFSEYEIDSDTAALWTRYENRQIRNIATIPDRLLGRITGETLTEEYSFLFVHL